jgi:hypothetical protein
MLRGHDGIGRALASMDLASLLLVGIFFALSWGFIVLCERL